jgi:hypothetical protein
MRIGKQLKALSLAVFAAMATALVGSWPRRFAKPASDYQQFAECPLAISECVRGGLEDSREKVTFSVAGRLPEQITLGSNCYVGFEKEPIAKEVSVKNNEPTESFYELSKRKNHLA